MLPVVSKAKPKSLSLLFNAIHNMAPSIRTILFVIISPNERLTKLVYLSFTHAITLT